MDVKQPKQNFLEYGTTGNWLLKNSEGTILDANFCLFAKLFDDNFLEVFRTLLEPNIQYLERIIPRNKMEHMQLHRENKLKQLPFYYLDLVYYYYELAKDPTMPPFYLRLVYLFLFIISPSTQKMFVPMSNIARLRQLKCLVVANLNRLFNSTIETQNAYPLVMECIHDIEFSIRTGLQGPSLVSFREACPILVGREALDINREMWPSQLSLSLGDLLTYIDNPTPLPLLDPQATSLGRVPDRIPLSDPSKVTPTVKPTPKPKPQPIKRKNGDRFYFDDTERPSISYEPTIPVSSVLLEPKKYLKVMTLEAWSQFYAMHAETFFMKKGGNGSKKARKNREDYHKYVLN
jgi:hypothetical protein